MLTYAAFIDKERGFFDVRLACSIWPSFVKIFNDDDFCITINGVRIHFSTKLLKTIIRIKKNEET